MDYGTLYNKAILPNAYIGEDAIDLLTLTYFEPSSYEYILFKVPAEYIARPDLISIDQYGNTDYVDVICKLNGISNPFELNEGMILVIPEPSYIHLFSYTSDTIEALNISQAELKGLSATPQPKTKNEKRKPNEAIVGDKRFKIDKDRRLVIY